MPQGGANQRLLWMKPEKSRLDEPILVYPKVPPQKQGVAVGELVSDGLAVELAVGVEVGVAVVVLVGLELSVQVGVSVDVDESVGVALGVQVGLDVGVTVPVGDQAGRQIPGLATPAVKSEGISFKSVENRLRW